jgi:PKD repeat protein
MKKNYSFQKIFKTAFGVFLTGLFLLSSFNIKAQNNLALKATSTHSGGGASASGYGPELYNDGKIPACAITGTYQWGWVTTNGWIEFTWTTSQKINKVVFYKANRPMYTCTFQYWNGTSYVDFYTYNRTITCKDSVTFSPVTTTKLRFNAVAGSSNPNFVEIQAFGPTAANDASISALKVPLCNPIINVDYSNSGTNTIDSVKINWSVNGNLQTQNKYNKPVTTGSAPISIALTPDYNFVDGDNYTVKAWTSLPNNKQDTFNSNDTLQIAFKYLGPAGTPSVSDVIKCGPGQAPLVATPVNKGDSILWYNAATGGSVIAKGKNTLSPPLVLGVNTFYAQAFKMSSPIKLANGMSGPTYCTGSYATSYVGSMMDFVPKSDIVVDSLAVDFYQFISNSTYNVYYKTNTYVGSEANAAAWTQLVSSGRANVQSVGGKNRGYLKIPQTSLAKGVTYGFYITTVPITGNDLFATSGTSTWSDANLSVTGGKYIYGTGLFGTQINNYYIDLEVYYKTQSCPSSRVPVQVTVKPSPNGAAFVKSTPFQTTQPTTIGSVGNPDIVAKGDKLTYEITPPTGYNNADYASTWIMSGFTLRTKSGRVISSSYYSPATPVPSGSANAKVTFSPDASLVDSTIIMTVSIRDLGPHYCDSTLTRNIFVAPRPVPDFKFGQPVCDGDAVIFTNTSSISSGNITHKWDFNTGNPADTSTNVDVVFTFPNHGTYDVKLITTSLPYGYQETKTIQVVVTEIPKIGFKVLNACLGDSVKFLNSTTISAGTIVYKWDFGNGTSSTKASPGKKYNAAGGYKVTLTATSNGCSQSLTKNAQQFARPVAKFSVPSTVCDKTDIPFSNGSTIPIGNMGYVWDFGDGMYSGYTNPLHTFSSPGAKIVKLRVLSEFGCADSTTKAFTLAEAPLANFTTGPVCNLSPTSFTFTGSKPTGALTNFLWNFSGEGTTTVENPSKQFNIIGKKTITLTLTSNNGCSDMITKEIDVKLQSKADFDVSDVCEDNEAVFTNKSTVSAGSLNYIWKFGDAKTSAAQSPRHLYPIAGTSQTFNVTLVAVVPGGCSDSINKPVSVNAKPSSNFTYTTSGRLVNFNAAQTGNTTYQWNFGDGGTSANPATQYHYLNSFVTAKFNACLTVINSAGCFSQTCKQVSITGGVNNLNKLSGVKIYPNPNKGNFTVTVEDPKSDIAIAVYNLLGELVKTVETTSLKSTYSIDLNVANGVYLVKVTNGGLTSTQKVTINR